MAISAGVKEFEATGLFSGTHYDVLGVNVSATPTEIQKAYKQRARQYHPDKNQNPKADDWMKKIVKAYEILSDQIERRSYDIKMQSEGDAEPASFDPVGALPPARQLSKTLMELFSVWMKKAANVQTGQFVKSLKEQLVCCQTEFNFKANKSRNSCPSVYDECLDIAKTVATKLNLFTSEQTRKAVTTIIECSRTNSNKQYPAKLSPSTLVPLIDLSRASASELLMLCELFSEKPDNLKSNELLEFAYYYIPQVSVQDSQLPDLDRKICSICMKTLPKKFHGACSTLPRFGQMHPQKVCVSCCEHTYREDGNMDRSRS